MTSLTMSEFRDQGSISGSETTLILIACYSIYSIRILLVARYLVLQDPTIDRSIIDNS